MSETCDVRFEDGDGGGQHCVHDQPNGDGVCCWCGDVFLPREVDGDHGRFVPEHVPDPTPAEQPAEDGAVCATCGGWKCLCQSRDLLAACVPCPDCATPAPKPATWCPVHGAGVPTREADEGGYRICTVQVDSADCSATATGLGAEAACEALTLIRSLPTHGAITVAGLVQQRDTAIATSEEYLRQLGQAGEVIRKRTAERDTAIVEAERLRRQRPCGSCARVEVGVEPFCDPATNPQNRGDGFTCDGWVNRCEQLRAQLAEARAERDRLYAAAEELLEVSDLRGDIDEIPHPCDDPKLWTARIIDAWSKLREVTEEVFHGE